MFVIQRWVSSEEQEESEFVFDIHIGDSNCTKETVDVPVCNYRITIITYEDGCVLRFCTDLRDGENFGWAWMERGTHIGNGVLM